MDRIFRRSRRPATKMYRLKLIGMILETNKNIKKNETMIIYLDRGHT